jgi:16S rRNA (uracil1498-N3)-methyltransferase
VGRELRRLLLSPARLAAAAATGVVPLQPPELHYLARVLRLRPDDSFAVVDGAGRLWEASLVDGAAQLHQPQAEPLQHQPAPRTRLQLAFAPPRRDAEVLLRMATELGIDALQPLLAERSVAERWNAVRAEGLVREAVEQCERLWSPELTPPCPARDCFAGASGLRLLATTRSHALPQLEGLLAEHNPWAGFPVSVAIGPEGGWSPDEEQAALAQGWMAVQLGPTILRTSTAAVAAATLLVNWRQRER